MIDMNDFGATIKCGHVPTIYAAHCFGVWGVFKVNLGKFSLTHNVAECTPTLSDWFSNIPENKDD